MSYINRDIVQNVQINSSVEDWSNLHKAINNINSLTKVVGQTNNEAHEVQEKSKALHYQADHLHKQTQEIQANLDANVEGLGEALEVANSAHVKATDAHAMADTAHAKALDAHNRLDNLDDSTVAGLKEELDELTDLVYADQVVLHNVADKAQTNKENIELVVGDIFELTDKNHATNNKVEALDDRVSALEGRDPTDPPVNPLPPEGEIVSLPERFTYQPLIDAAIKASHPLQEYKSAAYDKFNFVDDVESHAVSIMFLNSFVPELIKYYCDFETAMEAHNYAVVEGDGEYSALVMEYVATLKSLWNSDVFRVAGEDTAETVKARVDKLIEALTAIHITYNVHTPIHKLMETVKRYEARGY